MGLWANGQKDFVLIAQHQSKTANEAYNSKIAKTDMLIQAKQRQIKTLMEMAKILRNLSDNATAASATPHGNNLRGSLCGPKINIPHNYPTRILYPSNFLTMLS